MEDIFDGFLRFFDRYKKPITAFVILTDKSPSFRPAQFHRPFLGITLTYSSNSCKVLGQSTEILQTSENPFATVILTVLIALQKKKAKRKKDTDTDELFALKIDLAKRLLAHSFPKPKVRALTNFLRFYVCFDKHEISAKFDNKITVLQNEKTMGIEEFLLYRAEQQGIEESIGQGIEQQKYESVKNMLLRTTFPPEQIADILDVSVECVLQVKQEMQ